MTNQQKAKSSYLINLAGTLFSGLCMIGISFVLSTVNDMHKDVAELKEWKSMNEERAKHNEVQISQLLGDYKNVNDRQDKTEESVSYLEAILPEALRRKKS